MHLTGGPIAIAEEGPVGCRSTIAAVTLANGGDNIGVYVPVFAVAGASGMTVYVVVFPDRCGSVAVWRCGARPVTSSRHAP